MNCREMNCREVRCCGRPPTCCGRSPTEPPTLTGTVSAAHAALHATRGEEQPETFGRSVCWVRRPAHNVETRVQRGRATIVIAISSHDVDTCTPVNVHHSAPSKGDPVERYRITAEAAVYYVTYSVVDWLPVFVSEQSCRIITDSLNFCYEKKGLRVNAFVIRPPKKILASKTRLSARESSPKRTCSSFARMAIFLRALV
jgi:hypothetical protein